MYNPFVAFQDENTKRQIDATGYSMVVLLDQALLSYVVARKRWNVRVSAKIARLLPPFVQHANGTPYPTVFMYWCDDALTMILAKRLQLVCTSSKPAAWVRGIRRIRGRLYI